MTALQMVSLPVDLRSFRRISVLRGFANDEGRALHHLLSETFGKSLLQPFRLMTAPRGRVATLYAYTQMNENQLRENLELAAPELLVALGTRHLALRDMPENWREGRRLGFDLRIRPVRRLLKPLEGVSREETRRMLRGAERPGPFRKGSEVDAYLVQRLREFPDQLPEDNSSDRPSREAVYRDWLAERLEGAAMINIERTRMTRFVRDDVRRHGQISGEVAVGGPDATFHGELTIVDGKAFGELLKTGIGRHRAFGFGMLLLRPGAA